MNDKEKNKKEEPSCPFMMGVFPCVYALGMVCTSDQKCKKRLDSIE